MKKIISLLLVLALMFSFSGCRSLVSIESSGYVSEAVSVTQKAESIAEPTPAESVVTPPPVSSAPIQSEPLPESSVPETQEPDFIEKYNSQDIIEVEQAPEEVIDPRDVKPYDKTDEYRTGYNIGCNRNLKGKITVNCFYVNDDESSWSETEVKSFEQKQIAPALQYITDQAKLWSVDVSFDVISHFEGGADFSLNYNGVVNKNLREGGSTKDIFNQMAVSMGYASDSAMVVEKQGEERIDRDMYLMLINKNGTSYTRNLGCDGVCSNYDYDVAEHCVIFAEDLDYTDLYFWASSFFPQTRSATIVHEILHLYGAEDYYYPEERLALANQYYYDDIMVLNTYRLSENKIRAITAFSLGWDDSIPLICYEADWWTQ